MATIGRQRGGRGGGAAGSNGGGNGVGARGGGDVGNNQRRGSWRGGPPGSMGYSAAAKAGAPVTSPPAPATAGPRVSINDHMSDMKKVQVEKPAVNKMFQTDTDISGTQRSASGPGPRDLQPWSAPATETAPAASVNTNGAGPRSNGTATPVTIGSNGPRGAGKDNETFGGEDKNGKWDQFETNARLFGTKTSYQEEIYTTKLNKSGPDFKQREREAERLASEIMGQSSSNMHIMDERNQIVEGDWAKDDEEKYSGVQRAPAPAAAPAAPRNPNAYVPPAARKSQGGPGGPGGYAAAAGKALPTNTTAPTAKPNGGPAVLTSTPAPANNAVGGKATTPTPASKPIAPTAATEKAAASEATKPANANAQGSESAKAAPEAGVVSPQIVQPASMDSPSLSGAAAEPKEGLDKVVGAYRQFVDSEREKVVAKKQSMAKSEREKQLAELKKFQASFKVPLPMPKDILPILSKDEDRQKVIEMKAQVSLQAAKAEAEAKKQPSDLKSPPPAVGAAALPSINTPESTPTRSAPKSASKKIPMHIAEIPAFKTARKPSMTGATGPLAVNESAKTDIPQPVPASPAPSASAGLTAEQAKLNPKASAFVFKPTAAAFKPGQSSNTGSPAARAPQLAAAAGPSVPKNPFFGDQVPGRVTVDLRVDFNPFRHGQVPSASTIAPNWPYTGRPVQISFLPPGAPMGFGMEEDMTSPQFRPQQLMQGMQGWYPQNRYGQPGMPPQQAGQGPNGMQPNPMFSPGPGFAQLPGGMPQHMVGGPQQHQLLQHQMQQHPSGMPPMYFQNGLPQNPQFLPQHMQHPSFNQNQSPNQNQNPNTMPLGQHTPQRPGHNAGAGGPGLGSGPQGMYFQQQQQQGQGQGLGQGPGQGQGLSTPQHTPQMGHNMPFPPPGSATQPPHMQQQQHFQPSPMMLPQMAHPPATGYDQQQQQHQLGPGQSPGMGPNGSGQMPNQGQGGQNQNGPNGQLGQGSGPGPNGAPGGNGGPPQ